MNKFKYCPNCKSNLTKEEEKVFCTNCGFEFYFNPAPTVGSLIVKDSQVLLSIRKIDPFKGELDIIGGFVNNGETLEEAVIRETKEETGLDIIVTRYFNSNADTYGDDNEPIIATSFITKIVGGVLKANDDVAELKWINIKDLPNIKINSFEGVKKDLLALCKEFLGN